MRHKKKKKPKTIVWRNEVTALVFFSRTNKPAQTHNLLSLLSFLVFLLATLAPTDSPAEKHRCKKHQGQEKSHVQHVSLVPGLRLGSRFEVSSTSTLQDVLYPPNQTQGWGQGVGSMDPAEGQSCFLEPKGRKRWWQVGDLPNTGRLNWTQHFRWASTYLMSCIMVWMVELTSSLVMCVGLMTTQSPFASARTTLSNWSPNRGMASTGTAWYTACIRLFCPPWVMNRRAIGWP